jgi:hypothetical protein
MGLRPRQVLSVSKEELLKREPREKRKRERKTRVRDCTT